MNTDRLMMECSGNVPTERERRKVWLEAAMYAPIGGHAPPENWGRLRAEYADALLSEFDKRFVGPLPPPEDR